MSYEERVNAHPNLGDESDVEEEALVNDYREQVNFDDGMSELERTTSLGTGSQTQDLQAQLAAAATPLEYQATLETKFASYDNYCSLFHYILNSEGPVELEVPSVRLHYSFLPQLPLRKQISTEPGVFSLWLRQCRAMAAVETIAN